MPCAPRVHASVHRDPQSGGRSGAGCEQRGPRRPSRSGAPSVLPPKASGGVPGSRGSLLDTCYSRPLSTSPSRSQPLLPGEGYFPVAGRVCHSPGGRLPARLELARSSGAVSPAQALGRFE